MPLNIAIVGGGPAGLMLARLLHLSPTPIRTTIFESDIDARSRSQGSTLDLHPDSGLAAVKKAQLWTEFKQHVRYDGEALKFIDKNFTIWFETENPGASEATSNGRPEIDRARIRDILLNSVARDSIKWGRRLQAVEASPDKGNSFSLVFKDGSREDGFDLVVGADGAWSHVRSSYLSGQKPVHTGIDGLIGSIPAAEKTDPYTYKLVSRGSVFAYSDGKGINAQFIGDGSIKVTAWIAQPEGQHTTEASSASGDPFPTTNAAVQSYIAKHFAEWSPKLTRMFAHVDDSVQEAHLYMLPIDWHWEHRRGATLVGDAAHLMTPFAGEGVNLALNDAADLADAIISAVTAADNDNSKDLHDTLDAAVEAAEQKMYTRSRKIRQTTYHNMQDQFYTTGSVSKWLPRFAARTLLINEPGFAGGSEFLAGILLRILIWSGVWWRWIRGAVWSSKW